MAKLIRFKIICFTITCMLLSECIIPSFAWAEGEPVVIENIHFEQSGNYITIYYDLGGPIDQNYIVSIKLKSEDYNSFEYVPRNVSGDVGEGRFVGKNRKIIWSMLPESPPISSQYKFYFEVKAELLSNNINPLIWAGGAVVIGGIVALLFSSSSNEVSTQSRLPTAPPGRP
jgi:hypothetical protein